MNIVIKSTQIYEDSTEQIQEKYSGANVDTDHGYFRVEYEKGSIVVNTQDGTAWIKRDGNDIFIKINEKTLLNYETEYGKIIVETCGEKISYEGNPLKIVLEYQITINEIAKYHNSVEITEE